MDQPQPHDLRGRIAGMIERNPFELTLAAWWVLCGLLLMYSALTDFDPSPSFLVLPDWIALVMGAPILLGGVGALVSMLAYFENLADKWRLERLALWLVIAGLIGYSYAVLWYRPSSLLPAGMAGSMAVAAALRVRASVRQERRIRRDRRERRACGRP